jgi:hypothetical protein
VAPDIAAPVTTESVAQTAGAVTGTAIAGSTAEAAAKMIAAKTITSANATIPVAAGNALVESPELRKLMTISRTTVALRNIDDLCEILPASTS